MRGLSIYVQRIFLLLNGIFYANLGYGYARDSISNHYSVLNSLFTSKMVNTCTTSGCWNTLAPFLSSVYFTIALLSILAALLFRKGVEIRLVLVVVSFSHLIMGLFRLNFVPPEYYQEGKAIQTSQLQFILSLVLFIASGLPYSHEKTN